MLLLLRLDMSVVGGVKFYRQPITAADVLGLCGFCLSLCEGAETFSLTFWRDCP